MEKKMLKIASILFGALTVVLYSIISSAQILGFLKIYNPLSAILLTAAIICILTYIFLKKAGNKFFLSIFNKKKYKDAPSALSKVFYFCGLLILISMILLPLIGWPYTPINDTLHWDAGLYHFPKAVELYKTGSAWDFSIAYGEYPFGYESLIAFDLSISGNCLLFGTTHALIALFLFLAIWLLGVRYTKISPGLLFFMTGVLLISGLFAISSNIWWIYKFLIFTIGKNDLFLGAAILALILFAPIGNKDNYKYFDPLGMSVATAIAMSVKPNAVFIVVPIWLYTCVLWLRQSKLKEIESTGFGKIVLLVLIIIPGGLWFIRNVVHQGFAFSTIANDVYSWSILNNITDPRFYNFIPKNLYAVVFIVVFSFIICIIGKKISITIPAALLLLFIGFIATPATAFASNTQERAGIAWRFAIALLSYVYLVLLVLAEPIINFVYRQIRKKRIALIAVSIITLLFTGQLIYANRNLNLHNPKNDIVLIDQFRESVGTNGYFSAYDYVQRNVQNSVIQVENGLPFYVYGPDFSNSVTRQKPADYFIIFKTAWFGEHPENYPDYLAAETFNNTWKLVYEDSQGRVYKRK